jgi:Fur family iron response transcriptional regulator
MNSQFANLLTENDITLTKQRLEIAELIFVKDQHFTAIELIKKVKKSKLFISQATIYNTLCLFESKGLLKIINLQNEYKFFDTNLSSHHHLFNTSTNTLTDISNDHIVFTSLPDIPNHLEIEQTEVLIKVKNKQL